MDWIITIYFLIGVFQVIVWAATTLDVQWDISSEHIEEIASDDPEIRTVMTMPGMGHYASTTFVAEIGDVRRF